MNMHPNQFRKASIAISALGLALAFAPMSYANTIVSQEAAPAPKAPPTPAECGIPGHHALLERMTAAFVLTCEQELKLEPLLHDEESVSKPLINFAAFTPEEKKDVMLQVKLVARKQILPLLTPDQQAKMNQEITTVSKGGEGLQKGNGGGKSGGAKGENAKKKPEAASIDPFQAEQALCQALNKYAALSAAEKQDLIAKVKKASLRPDAPAMTPEQAKQVAAEIE